MVFLILIYLVLACLPLPWPDPLIGGGLAGSLSAAAALTVVPIAAAWLIARRTERRLLAEPYRRDETLHEYSRWRTRHLLLLILSHLLMLTACGWPWAVRQLCGVDDPRFLPFGAELLLVLPFVLALVLSWAVFYRAERAAFAVSTGGLDGEEPYGGRWSYVGFLARQHLAMISVPLGLFIVEQGLVRQYEEVFGRGPWRVALIGLVVVALVLAPLALRFILRTQRLADGPLRDRLDAARRRLKFRCSDILLWNTRNGVANAMVAGPLPLVRYVFLSDRLLQDLPPDEVEAVFGHEVGHVRHGHFPYYLLFITLSLLAVVGLWETGLDLIVGNASPAEEFNSFLAWREVPELMLVGAYLFVAFGFLSRRCERQADLYGCRAVSCADPACIGHDGATVLAPAAKGLCPTGVRTFIRALDRVALVNGISRRKPGWLQSWLHGSIDRRISFLEQVISDGSTAPRFQRRVGLIKWGLIGALLFVLGGLFVAGSWEHIWSAL